MALLFGVLFFADQTTSSGLAEVQEFGEISADRMLKTKKKKSKKSKKSKKKAKKMKKALKKMKKDMKKMKKGNRRGWGGASNLVATVAMSAIATSALMF